MNRHEAIGDSSEVPKFARLLNRLEKIIVILRLAGDRLSAPSSVQDMIPGIGIFDSKRASHNHAISDRARSPFKILPGKAVSNTG